MQWPSRYNGCPTVEGTCVQRYASNLHAALTSIWPKRSQQEILLDLGERKAWTWEQHGAAIQRFDDWIVLNLELPETAQSQTPVTDEEVLAFARTLRVNLGAQPKTSVPDVAAWIEAIAPVLGAGPKALANSLRTLRAARADHRWLRVIAQVARGEGASDAWCFHRRTPRSVAACVASWTEQSQFNAGDAVVLLSFLALWQRRRPTHEAKGNRGQQATRRLTPKPIAAMSGALIQPGQVLPLVELSQRLEHGAALALLTIEAALSEAHLAPHRPRARARTSTGEAWLTAVEKALPGVDSLLESNDRRAIGFRLERLRAWRDGRTATAPEDAVMPPYVRASTALEQRLPMTFKSNTPGLLMLLPQLRSREMLEST